MFLKSTIMALALAGTALVTANAANAQDYNRNQTNAQDTSRNRDNAQNYDRNRANAQNNNRPSVTVAFGNVGMGYRNGYMGNDHNWHRWQHRNDYISYRNQHRDQYHDWNHR
ncbi:MAG TPA: hypothetical protein VNX61_00070 [Rhizomicrobium sp.]|jgi:hypothetical protein|nr:hypothetical protein [Rhizomicrobium sp.]